MKSPFIIISDIKLKLLKELKDITKQFFDKYEVVENFLEREQ